METDPMPGCQFIEEVLILPNAIVRHPSKAWFGNWRRNELDSVGYFVGGEGEGEGGGLGGGGGGRRGQQARN